MIEVNEYVRTKNGVIDKVDALYGMIENTVHLENQKWFDIKNITKHSKQLIDLIEVGDYVNGHLVVDVDDINTGCMREVYCEDDEDFGLWNEHINTIVTKEQYKSVEYIVKEEQ